MNVKYAIKNMLKNMKEKFFSWLENPRGTFVLFILLLILINLVASRAFIRWDITGPKSYSLSQASRQVVRTLDEPLSVKVFFSDNLQAPYSTVNQYVRDLLAEYKNAGSSNFTYEYFDMDKEENQELAANYGVQQFQIREIKNNEVGFKNAFMGLVISYADQTEILNGLSSTDGLEYKITTAINKVIAGTNALSGLSEGVAITLYRSSNLRNLNLSGFDELESVAKQSVNNLNKKYEGVLNLSIKDPASSEVPVLQEKYGTPTFPLKDGNGNVSYGTLALVMESGEKSKMIPFQLGQTLDLMSGTIGYTVQGMESLEENMDETLKALASNVSTIAYITGHGELSLSDEENGAAIMTYMVQDRYTFKEVNLSESDIPLNVESVMINGPKSAFTELELYKIDQFLMKGGNLIVFQDPFGAPQQDSPYSMPTYTPLQTGLEKILEKNGIKMQNVYTMDKQCAKAQTQQGFQEIFYAPLLDNHLLNQKHPVSKNLGETLILQPGSIDVSEARKISGENVTVLARTSAKSWTVSEDFILQPGFITEPDASQMKSEDIAVLVEGKFTSAFDKAVKAEKQKSSEETGGDGETDEEKEDKPNETYESDSHLSKSIQNGKIMVFSTSYVTGSFLSQQIFQTTGLLLENAIDYMNDKADLCAMRTKGLSLNTLKTNKGFLANTVKYFNEIGLAVICALVGLMVLVFRNRRKTQIRLQYNPEDDREIIVEKKSLKGARK